MELFNKEGHLTDEGLRAVVDGTLDEVAGWKPRSI